MSAQSAKVQRRACSVYIIELLPTPHGWPMPLTKTMARGSDFLEAFVEGAEVWVKMADQSRYRIPLAHVLYTVPDVWP